MVRRFPIELPRRGFIAAAAAATAMPLRAEAALSVFAAASLKPALDGIAGDYPGGPVAVSYAGSGTIARQVAAGAPADVVILAATDWMDWLAEEGALRGAPQPVATNRLVLAGPRGAAPVALTQEAMLDRLAGGRMAMGDPMSVPAGRYAQQALESLGLWTALAPHALMAENVRAALAYVARGDVRLGLVYGSDVRGAAVDIVAEIPPGSHARIVYPGAVTRMAGAGAEAFLDHVAAAAGRFARHGFREGRA